tara:strand:- start:1377 stop:3569 length:2193 start_codon:yes stop_codon:yes gene_type:complete
MARYNSYGQLDTQYRSDVDGNFSGFNDRSRPDTLESGMLQKAENFRFDISGTAQVRKAIQVKSAPLTVDSNSAFTLPFYAYANVTASSASVTTNTVTLNFSSAHGIVDETLVSVSGMTGLTNYTDGNFKANRVDEDTIEITSTGVSGTPGGTIVVGAPKLVSASLTQVYGSCKFTDPGSDNEEYIIIAGNSNAVAIKMSDNTTTSISYPSGEFVTENAHMMQAMNQVFIFRDTKTTLTWDGDLSSSPAFAKVSNGAFTQPIKLETASNTVIANGKVTVSENSHNLETGDIVVVTDSAISEIADGSQFGITKIDANSFYFYADAPNTGSAQSSKYIGKVSEGSGFMHMPAAPFGILHENRIIVPYFNTSASSPAVRDPAVRDEILISEPHEANKYDEIYKRGTLHDGSADFIVGLFSFTDDKLIVFSRESIHIVSPTVNFPQGTVTSLVTKEVGLVARNSVVQVGNNVLFLSDNGVYGASFQDLYNLRGNEVPLSEPIQKTINRINKAHASKAVAVYFDNRYYLAVPLDDSTKNNAILIYSFLNKKWESVDSVNSTAIDSTVVNWDIQNLIVAGGDADRSVYAVNELGGLHKIDAVDSSYDQVITSIGGNTLSAKIPALLKTRQFNFENTERKKWNTFELHFESSDNESSDFNIAFNTENIDDTIDSGLASTLTHNAESIPSSESVSIRGRIGNRRAYGIDMQLDNFTGRPKIELIQITGGLEFKSTQPVQ